MPCVSTAIEDFMYFKFIELSLSLTNKYFHYQGGAGCGEPFLGAAGELRNVASETLNINVASETLNFLGAGESRRVLVIGS